MNTNDTVQNKFILLNTVKLLRIPFSYFLLPVFLFALSQVEYLNFNKSIICFFILHLFIYPASNGYNSFMDQDEGSIGGLETPPVPTKHLLYASLLLDISGLLFSLIIGVKFCISLLAYIMASRAYSYKGIRLKKFPFAGFITVVFFQGAFTYWMVISTVSDGAIEVNKQLLLALFSCSFLIAGVYPITQIYQHEADKKNGDITISYLLGIKGTFYFTVLMFLIANIFLLLYFNSIGKGNLFVLFQVFLFPVIFYFISWYLKVVRDKSEASYKNTMRMNFLASSCMNIYFLLLFIMNNNQ